jgi:outer membrane protein assembly factor BamB
MALDLETGDIAWTTNHGSDQPMSVRENTVVLAGNDGGLYGLDASTGDQLWLYPSGKQQLTAPVISGDFALVGAGNALLAIDLGTGQPAWYYVAGDVVVSSPIVANGYVWFGSRDGFLNAVTVEQS